MKHNITRRQLLKSATATAVLPYLVFSGNQAFAAQVDPAAAQAKALEYSHQSPVAGKNCANCQLYTGDAAKEWGPCAIFPGQEVATAGWCNAWAAKA